MKTIVKKSVEIYNQNKPHFYQLFIDSPTKSTNKIKTHKQNISNKIATIAYRFYKAG